MPKKETLRDYKLRLEAATKICENVQQELCSLAQAHHHALRRLESAEASNQNLSTEHARISNVAQKFAEHKERDQETIAKLTGMLESAFKANQRILEERDAATKALEELRNEQ